MKWPRCMRILFFCTASTATMDNVYLVTLFCKIPCFLHLGICKIDYTLIFSNPKFNKMIQNIDMDYNDKKECIRV